MSHHLTREDIAQIHEARGRIAVETYERACNDSNIGSKRKHELAEVAVDKVRECETTAAHIRDIDPLSRDLGSRTLESAAR